jgi:hypothetical protein
LPSLHQNPNINFVPSYESDISNPALWRARFTEEKGKRMMFKKKFDDKKT